LGQLANFEGAAEIIRDYQECMQPWDDNEPVDLEYFRGCGGRGIQDGMEIARLTAICRKSDCGPLENEIVRLRQQIRTLEERKTGDSKSEAEEEMEVASQADAEGELARVRAELEEEKLKNAELDSEKNRLHFKNSDLEIDILEIKSKLASPPPCKDCVVHEEDYKWLSDRYDEKLDEDLQQRQRIVELEFENEVLKDQMAMMAIEGPVAGAGDDLSAKEQAYQQAQRQHSS
jgi:chromosome segregation ATPase